ncbi:MAG TPA: N-acetylmuramoyl-L-alanine amidase [Terriglobales bacterium]|nr:N-acetylmuramoyl-L-alanine amidase [Terriglobales bacterium]
MISNDKPSSSRGLHRIRVRASGAPAPDWDALQVLLAFAYTIQQEELRIVPQRRTDAPLRAAQLLPVPPIVHGDIESVLHRIAASVQNLTGASGAAIALGRTDSMICIARSGSHAPEVGSYLDATRGLAGECARSGEPRICVNTSTDTRVDPVSARKLGIGSMVYYPLRWRSELMGLLGVFSERAYQFQYRDVRALRFAEALVIDALNQNPEDTDFALSHGPSATAADPKAAFVHVPQSLKTSELDLGPVLELPPNTAPPITSGVFINKPVAGTLEDGRSPLESLARVEMPEPAEKPPSPPASAAASPILEHAEEILSDPEPQANWQEDLDDVSCVVRHAHTVGEAEPATAPVPYWTPKPLPDASDRQLGGLAFLLSALVAVMFAGAWMWRLPMVDWMQSHFALHAKKPTVNASTKTEAEGAKPDAAAPRPMQTAAALNPEELTAKDSRQLLEHVQYWAGPGYSRMTIQLEKSIKYSSNRVHDPERVYFDLDTRLLDVHEKQFAVDDSLIRSIRMGEYKPGMTRIVFDLKVAGSYTASLADNPPRLIIEFFEKEAHSRKTPAQVTSPAQEVAQWQASAQSISDPAEHPGRIKIVVDPGHGGHDTGSVSSAGLMEKDLTLDVAQKLGHLLEKELGAEVIYTRTDDRFVALDSRVATANDAHADFFISIHANSSQYKTVNGVETFYFNSSSEAMESVKVSPLPTGVSAANSSSKAAARRFATDVQKSLLRALSRKGNPMRDRGIKTAPFVVLREAQMPAVLAEIAFMTSKTDAVNLMTDSYREKIAEALYTGIANNVQRTRTLAKAGPSGAQAGMN